MEQSNGGEDRKPHNSSGRVSLLLQTANRTTPEDRQTGSFRASNGNHNHKPQRYHLQAQYEGASYSPCKLRVPPSGRTHPCAELPDQIPSRRNYFLQLRNRHAFIRSRISRESSIAFRRTTKDEASDPRQRESQTFGCSIRHLLG